MSRPKEHVHITFLTLWIVFVGILGFQSLTNHYERPCTSIYFKIYINLFYIHRLFVMKIVQKQKRSEKAKRCRNFKKLKLEYYFFYIF